MTGIIEDDVEEAPPKNVGMIGEMNDKIFILDQQLTRLSKLINTMDEALR